jgi:glutamate-1-semialdehyde 2,1-aminomutase
VRVLPNFEGTHPPDCESDNAGFVPFGGDVNALDGPKNAKQVAAMRQGMLLHGVDWWGFAGMTSCEHSAADVAATVTAMEATLTAMTEEGLA